MSTPPRRLSPFDVVELRDLIARHLSPGDICQATQVCKTWHTWWNPYLWKTLKWNVTRLHETGVENNGQHVREVILYVSSNMQIASSPLGSLQQYLQRILPWRRQSSSSRSLSRSDTGKKEMDEAAAGIKDGRSGGGATSTATTATSTTRTVEKPPTPATILTLFNSCLNLEQLEITFGGDLMPYRHSNHGTRRRRRRECHIPLDAWIDQYRRQVKMASPPLLPNRASTLPWRKPPRGLQSSSSTPILRRTVSHSAALDKKTGSGGNENGNSHHPRAVLFGESLRQLKLAMAYGVAVHGATWFVRASRAGMFANLRELELRVAGLHFDCLIPLAERVVETLPRLQRLQLDHSVRFGGYFNHQWGAQHEYLLTPVGRGSAATAAAFILRKSKPVVSQLSDLCIIFGFDARTPPMDTLLERLPHLKSLRLRDLYEAQHLLRPLTELCRDGLRLEALELSQGAEFQNVSPFIMAYLNHSDACRRLKDLRLRYKEYVWVDCRIVAAAIRSCPLMEHFQIECPLSPGGSRGIGYGSPGNFGNQELLDIFATWKHLRALHLVLPSRPTSVVNYASISTTTSLALPPATGHFFRARIFKGCRLVCSLTLTHLNLAGPLSLEHPEDEEGLYEFLGRLPCLTHLSIEGEMKTLRWFTPLRQSCGSNSSSSTLQKECKDNNSGEVSNGTGSSNSSNISRESDVTVVGRRDRRRLVQSTKQNHNEHQPHYRPSPPAYPNLRDLRIRNRTKNARSWTLEEVRPILETAPYLRAFYCSHMSEEAWDWLMVHHEPLMFDKVGVDN